MLIHLIPAIRSDLRIEYHEAVPRRQPPENLCYNRGSSYLD